MAHQLNGSRGSPGGPPIPLERQAKSTISQGFFPHLPAYAHPTAGLLSTLPPEVVAYAELMRLDRPAGWYSVYIPFLIGLVHAGCIAGNHGITNSLELAQLAVRLVPFTILLRSAACTWNDTVDQNFDRRVARTRHRPIARGSVSTYQALVFALAQIILAFVSVQTLLPEDCLPHVYLMVTLSLVYALMKRITFYPQVVLGIGCAWPIFFSSSAVGINPQRLSTLSLFGSNLLWSVINDTFYAFQDVADDERAGVKGMALKCGDNMKVIAFILSFGQVGLLALCGYSEGFSLAYHIFTVGGVAVSMFYYISEVQLQCPDSCGLWFRWQFILVGSAHLSGLLGQYLW